MLCIYRSPRSSLNYLDHAKHDVVVARIEVVVESTVEVVDETRKNFPSRLLFSSVWSATPVFFLESQTPQEARAAIIRTKLLCKLITIKILRNVYRCMVNKYSEKSMTVKLPALQGNYDRLTN